MKSIILNFSFDEPILLHCWKHHAGFIKAQIRKLSTVPEFRISLLNDVLLTIGNSVTDIYTGSLTPEKIHEEIGNFIQKNNLKSMSGYKDWLSGTNVDYRIFELSDKSQWTFRFGDDKKRFVHVHPARNIELTIRVKALTLKTAITVLLISAYENKDPFDLYNINNARQQYLSSPPLKYLNKAGKLFELLKLLYKN